MGKVIIFGAGRTGQRIYEEIKGNAIVIGFIDNDEAKWGTTCRGVPILGNVKCLKDKEYDKIVLGTLAGSDVMKKELIEYGVVSYKIDDSYVSAQVIARERFLTDFASISIVDDRVAVAEGGVFQGEFAKIINREFPDLKFHLFDTFEGFDARDTAIEHANNYSDQHEGHFNITSENLVLGKLPHKDKAIIHKGYFPESLSGVPEEQYIFVSLDFDLYQPTLEGLRYFFPRMIKGGCILVDDYFGIGYRGIAEAVRQFEEENGYLHKGPIGDHSGLAIYK